MLSTKAVFDSMYWVTWKAGYAAVGHAVGYTVAIDVRDAIDTVAAEGVDEIVLSALEEEFAS